MTQPTNASTSDEFSEVILWRIIETNPPTIDDFKSHRERGIQLRRPTPDALRLWNGVSVYRDRDAAMALAQRLPHLGAFVAALRIPLDGTITVELDNRRNGHCTIWAAPYTLARLVVGIEPV